MYYEWGIISRTQQPCTAHTKCTQKGEYTHTHTPKMSLNHTREMLPPLRWGMMDYLALRHPVQTTTHWIQNKQNQTKSSHLKMATNKQKRNTKQPLTHTRKHTHAGAALSDSSCLEGGRDVKEDEHQTIQITKSKTAAASTHPGQFLRERLENVTATQR